MKNKVVVFLVCAALLLALPLFAQQIRLLYRFSLVEYLATLLVTMWDRKAEEGITSVGSADSVPPQLAAAPAMARRVIMRVSSWPHRPWRGA